jgi:hypothetical protein
VQTSKWLTLRTRTASKGRNGVMERFTLAGLLILMLCVPAAFAQKKKADPTRTVRGEVTAADNTAAVGAVVQLEDTKTKQVRSFITQQNGAYYFMGLSPDTVYELRA